MFHRFDILSNFTTSFWCPPYFISLFLFASSFPSAFPFNICLFLKFSLSIIFFFFFISILFTYFILSPHLFIYPAHSPCLHSFWTPNFFFPLILSEFPLPLFISLFLKTLLSPHPSPSLAILAGKSNRKDDTHTHVNPLFFSSFYASVDSASHKIADIKPQRKQKKYLRTLALYRYIGMCTFSFFYQFIREHTPTPSS